MTQFKKTIYSIVLSIESSISNIDDSNVSKKEAHFHSLLQGYIGVCLFYGYLSKYSKEQKYLDKCLLYLEDCLDSVAETVEPSLYEGITGIAWLVRHLYNIGIIDQESLDILLEVDSYIDKSLQMYIDRKYTSVMYGSIGVGIYYLEKIKNKKKLGISYREERKQISKIVNSLFHSCEMHGDKLTWSDVTSLEYYKNSHCIYNLGTPHGISGIVSFLGQVYLLKIETDLSKKMILGASNWLLSCRQNFHNISYYPSLLVDDEKPKITRLAWSYGDLCVALALSFAADVLDSDKFRKEAIRIALLASERTIPNSLIYVNKKLGTVDPAISKGSSGIAILFKHLYRKYDFNKLGEAWKYWFNLTLESHVENNGIGGFTSYVATGKNKAEWKGDVGFLEGVSGIGLVLISELNRSLDSWKSLLLIPD